MDDRTNMTFERIAGLTVKQSAFLMEYAKTENLSQACRVAGINRSTGYKYLENEDFQAALEQTKNKIVNAAWTKLSSQLEKAVDKVQHEQHHEHLPEARDKAARTVYDIYAHEYVGDIYRQAHHLEKHLVVLYPLLRREPHRDAALLHVRFIEMQQPYRALAYADGAHQHQQRAESYSFNDRCQ